MIVSEIAKKVGKPRRTIYRWIEKCNNDIRYKDVFDFDDEEVTEILSHSREVLKAVRMTNMEELVQKMNRIDYFLIRQRAIILQNQELLEKINQKLNALQAQI